MTTVARCSLDVIADNYGTTVANNDDLLRQTAALIKKQNTQNHNSKCMQRQNYSSTTIKTSVKTTAIPESIPAAYIYHRFIPITAFLVVTVRLL